VHRLAVVVELQISLDRPHDQVEPLIVSAHPPRRHANRLAPPPRPDLSAQLFDLGLERIPLRDDPFSLALVRVFELRESLPKLLELLLGLPSRGLRLPRRLALAPEGFLAAIAQPLELLVVAALVGLLLRLLLYRVPGHRVRLLLLLLLVDVVRHRARSLPRHRAAPATVVTNEQPPLSRPERSRPNRERGGCHQSPVYVQSQYITSS